MNLDYDYLISFDDTPPNKVSKQLFHFTLFSDKWTVEERILIHGIYNPFSVKRVPSPLRHQQLVLYFKPISVSQRKVCYYTIKCVGQKDIVLRVTGKGEVLRVQMSLKHIEFFRLNENKKTKVKFKLLNNSGFSVLYQFDIDNDQKIFEILPLSGSVEPFKDVLISATFTTKKEGIFMLDVPCLFPYNRPIYLQLFGANSSTMDVRTYEIYLATYLDTKRVFGFGDFFRTNDRRNRVCSMNETDFSFSSGINKFSTFVEALNHTDECLRIIWDIDNKNNFMVHPAIMNLRPKERRPFECRFEPKCKDALMGGHIYGKAQLYDLESTAKKEMVYLKLHVIGNSFEKEKIWNPNLLIPPFVQLPTCYANNSVYSTFVVRRSGPYPVTFNFLPPPNSNCEVRPKVGIIKNDFQIFVVQFNSKRFFNAVYTEDWKIELNGMPDYITSITFRNFVDEPKVLVGENSTVDFGSLFPGATNSFTIPVTNISATPLKIIFGERNDWFSVSPKEKIIDTFDSENFVFTYVAGVDVPKKSDLLYEVYVMPEVGVVVGKPYIFPVTILADCAYSQLSSVPSYHNFKDIVCGEEHTTKFRIYNFGKSAVKFVLKCYKHFGSAEKDPFEISPTAGCLEPEENMEVTVKLCSYEDCIGSYCIRYKVSLSEYSDTFIKEVSSIFKTDALIFKMEYETYYPTIQVVDIGKNQTGAFYGKQQIGKFFQLEKFNEILRTIKANETREISVRLPDAQKGLNISKLIVFILKNVSNTDTTCRLERKKICDCKLEQVKGTFTFRKYSFKCPHKNILKVKLLDEEIKALDTTFMNVEVFYKMEKTQIMCYLMRLSHNRTVAINFTIKSLESGELSTYLYGFLISLKNVSIRELTPAVQIYKLSNNTDQHSSYRITEEPIKELNRKAGYPVLTCLNPAAEVMSKSFEGLMFIFAPISLSKICVDVPIQLGSFEHVLHIEGQGTMDCKNPLMINELYDPCKEYYTYPLLMANISTEEITIRALPTFSNATRIFTLRNVTKDRTLAFWFASSHIEGMITCTVEPTTGLLTPGCCITAIINVTSYSMPCYCRTFCSLHLIDQTALNQHFKSYQHYYQEANTTNDFFTITDNSTVYYSKPKAQIERPPVVFHRNITVTCNIIACSEMELIVPLNERIRLQPTQELHLFKGLERTSIIIDEELDTFSSSDTKSSSTPDPFQEILRQNEDLLSEDICTNEECFPPSSDCQFSAVNIIAETVIRDVIASEKFRYKLNSYISSEPELYYHNFCKENRNPETDQKMTQLAFNRIPDNMLSEIMQVLIGNAVIHHFKLGAYPDLVIDPTRPSESFTNVGKKLYSEKFAFALDT